jgi:hypothetical protein
MKLYAELPRYRARQLARDVLTLLWIALWLRIGLRIHELVTALATPGRIIAGAGNDLTRSAEAAGRDLLDVPVIGEGLRLPFEAIAGAGRTLQAAGASQQDVAGTLAVWLGFLFAAVPIAFVLLKYVPERYRWVREATAAERIRLGAGDLYIFALRAAVNRPLWELKAATPDPAAALAAGDYEDLARLELNALGLGARDLAPALEENRRDAAAPGPGA